MSYKKPYRVICRRDKTDTMYNINRLRCKTSSSKNELHFLVDERKKTVTWTKFRSQLFHNYKPGYCRIKFNIISDVIDLIRPDFIGLKCDKKTPSIRGRVITAIHSARPSQRVLVISDYFVVLATISIGNVSVMYYQRTK